MYAANSTKDSEISKVFKNFGSCVELIPIDPHFQNVSIGLYVQNSICSIWSFSQKKGIQKRIEHIRNQMIHLGDLEPIQESFNQAKFPCGVIHQRPLRFLISQATNKNPDFKHPSGNITIQDSKSDLKITATPRENNGSWDYNIEGKGEAKNASLRIKMIVAGFMKYGEMIKTSDTSVAFECGKNHDNLMKIILPYSRNISSVEGMMETEALRGQMTTGTLGFSVT
ncbi:MAG: hypothetical protein CL735_00475 [Chloroflexi bacterium]|nr:hypothetical protein [Chloroflexota bacterium]|tara:strand:+ start:113264 stop:113941 length:678 start_codon:yes stop_codon:yes gene_type:complete